MIKRYLTFTLFLFCIGKKSTAQQLFAATNNLSPVVNNSNYSLTGKILDAKTGAPLPRASIYLADLKLGTIADENGKFNFKNLPAGKHLIEISYTGYTTFIDYVDVTTQSEIVFSLTPTIVENNTAIVTGVTRATSLKKVPVSIIVLNRKELLSENATNLIEALTRKPGISAITTGPAIAKPIIRGLGYNRVVVLNDGVRQEGQQWGDEHGIEIDQYSSQRIEILKGPASLMYGSDALAGVINIIGNLPSSENKWKGSFLTEYQTNNRLYGMHANIGKTTNGFNWNVYVSQKAAKDYSNKFDGKVLNSRFKETNFGGIIGLNKSWGYSNISFSRFNQKVGLIKGERDDATGKFIKLINDNGVEDEIIATEEDYKSYNPLIPMQQIIHTKLSLDNRFNFGKDRLNVLLSYQRNERKEFGNIIEPDEKELYFDLKTLNYNLQYHFAEKNQFKTTIGINGMQQKNKNKGAESLIPEYDLFDFGAFIYSQKTISKTTISGGMRFDNRSINSKEFREGSEVKFTSFKKNYSNLSASIGISHEASKQTVIKLNFARGFRAPSIPELSSNGAHEGSNRYEYGRQNLKSETSFQMDAGIDFNSDHISFSASVFYNSIQNYIYYSKLFNSVGGDSILVVDGEDLYAFEFKQQNANLYGAEISFDIHPHPLDWLHIDNSFSYVRGKLTTAQDGSNNLPNIPPARLINEIRADLFKNSKSMKNFYLKFQLENNFAQNNAFTGFNTETNTPAFTLLNAGIGTDIVSKKGKQLFTIHFNANNITNTAYQNHLNRLKYTAENLTTGRQGVFNMGRNFNIKLIFQLNG